MSSPLPMEVEHNTPTPNPTPVEYDEDNEQTNLELGVQDSPVGDAPNKPDPSFSKSEMLKMKEGYALFQDYLVKHGEEEEEEEELQLFEGSTHSFVVNFAETKDVPRLIIAIFVIIIQLVLYIVTATDALNGASGDDFTIPVKVKFGRNCTQTSNLVCAPEMPDLAYTMLAACILAFFLMHDLVAGIRLIVTVPGLFAKLTGVLMLFETVLAAFIGTVFALSANEGYDAIANCIGVLFIHDVDEKAFEAVQALKIDNLLKNNRCTRLCKKLSLPLPAVFISTFSVMVFAMSLAAIIRNSQFENLQKIYGANYVDKYWGADGQFDYDEQFGADDYDGAEYWTNYAKNGYWGTTAHPTQSPTASPTPRPTVSPTPKPTPIPPTPQPTENFDTRVNLLIISAHNNGGLPVEGDAEEDAEGGGGR